MKTRNAVVEIADRLDRIARAAYGSEKGGTVEALLEANPNLAGFVGNIPAGTRIRVPEVVEDAPVSTRPWL